MPAARNERGEWHCLRCGLTKECRGSLGHPGGPLPAGWLAAAKHQQRVVVQQHGWPTRGRESQIAGRLYGASGVVYLFLSMSCARVPVSMSVSVYRNGRALVYLSQSLWNSGAFTGIWGGPDRR